MENAPMTLFDMVAEVNELMRKIAENSGEITPEIDQQLSIVELAIPAKLDKYAFVIDRLKNETEYWKAKADEAKRIAIAADAARERLKLAITTAMQALGKDEVIGEDKRIKFVNNPPSVLVEDEAKIPNEHFIIEKRLDKAGLLLALKSGAEIPGASIQQGRSIRFYANRGNK